LCKLETLSTEDLKDGLTDETYDLLEDLEGKFVEVGLDFEEEGFEKDLEAIERL
jgi:hypothetical protein